jgi:hypothetical protein
MALVAELVFGASPLSGSALPTGGDIASDGSKVIIRTYSNAYVFLRPAGGSMADAFAAAPCRVPAPVEGQGEAIAFSSDAWSYYTLSEGTDQRLYRMDCTPGSEP